MNPLIFWALIQFRLGDTSQNCSNGCLRCISTGSTDFICQLCDFELFYTRYGYKCKQNILENCQKTENGKTCKVCKQGFYLNDSQVCVKMPTAIQDCLYSSTVNTCSECLQNNYFDDSTKHCLPAKKDISSCKIYDSESTCSLCIKSQLQNKTTCLSNYKNSENCDQFTGKLQCLICKPGYILVKNKYLIDMLDTQFFRAFYSQYITNKVNYQSQFTHSTNVCVKAISNCITPGEKFYQCKACETGYYLENNYCYKNPVPTIKNCYQYQVDSQERITCLACLQGYYISNDSLTCTQHQPIEKCITYDPSIANVCVECEGQYYLNTTNNTCNKRQYFLDNCLVYQKDVEKVCTECQDGYKLSPSSACVQEINKCEQDMFLLGSPDKGSIATLICKSCIPGFYIQTLIQGDVIVTTCELPDEMIEGCNRYQTETQCVECQQMYYLSNFSCQPMDQDILDNLSCQKLSITTKNDCVECRDDQFLFKLYNYCQQLADSNKISNCLIYEQSGSDIVCKQCNPFYYYDKVNKQCILTSFTDCTQVDLYLSKCVNCDVTKELMPNNFNVGNQCVKIPDYLISNCTNFQYQSDKNEAISCVECEQGYYPRVFDSPYYSFCVTELQLRNFKSKLTEIDKTNLTNCLAFSFTDKQCAFCDQAGAKKFISGKSCESSCTSDEIAQVFVFVEKGTQPISFMQCIRNNQLTTISGGSLDNCKIIDFDISKTLSTVTENQIPRGCIECQDGYKGYVSSVSDYYYNHYVHLPARNFPSSTIKDKYYFSIWNKNAIYNNCLQFNSLMESSTYKLLKFTKVEGTSFPSFRDGFDYKNIGTMSDVSSNQAYFANAKTLVKYSIGQLDTATTIQTITFVGIQSCVFGTSGVIVSQTMSHYTMNSNNTPIYTNYEYYQVIQCVKMDSCDTNVFYTGICNHDYDCRLDLLLSCSQCLDQQNIPTVPEQVKPWSIPSSVPATSDDGTQSNWDQFGAFKLPSVMITNKERANLVTSCERPGIFQSNQYFPANCGVQLVLNLYYVMYQANDNSRNPNPVCIACKPKYKPTFSSANIKNQNFKYVLTCDPIENCLSSNEFNKCQKCKPNYVLKYNADSTNRWKTEGEDCVANDMEGCLVGSDTGSCFKCLPGYFLNESNFCDKVLDTECTEMGTLDKDSSNAYNYLNDNPFRLGCISCQDSMFSIYFNFAPQICITNTTAKANTTLNANFVIDKCQSFSFSDGKVHCQQCNQGYFGTKDNSECIKGLVNNCMLYEKLLDSSYSCVTCKDRYYLQNNACIKGEINGCVVYNTKESCNTCENGYISIKVFNNQYSLCFQMQNTINNCTSYDTISGFLGIIKCNQCSSLTYAVQFTLAIRTCSTFPKVDNCKVYNKQDSLQDSTFSCLECNQGFYAQSNSFPSICRKRANYPIYNCQAYLPNSDQCQSCMKNFYLSWDKVSCIKNPDGIQFCRKYESQKKCAECEAPYVMKNGDCVPVPTQNLVQKCYLYSSDLLCLKCEAEYNLTGNLCEKVVIQNCLSIGFSGVCTQCENGYQFFKDSCQKTNVNNCITFIDPNTCSLCSKGFKLVSGRCFEAKIISSCVAYGETDNCTMCDEGLVLEPNRDKCTQLTDAEKTDYLDNNCLNYDREVTCYICDQGYSFQGTENTCMRNSVGNCAYVNPFDETKCQMCLSGFFMKTDGTCVENQVIVTQTDLTNNVKSDYYLEFNSQRLLQIIASMVLLFFFNN